MHIKLDEGYLFGLGVFETIAVVENRCIFLNEHLSRLHRSLKQLGIQRQVSTAAIYDYISSNPMKNGVLKVIVSEENTVISSRKNVYSKEHYEKGFIVGLSDVIRNETSPFTYMKSLNYGDNIVEKRRAKQKGWDESLFLNTKGQICEGATTNLFFVKSGKLFTPPICCGMLDGIMRSYLMKNYDIIEQVITPKEMETYDEMFLTNSLVGAMPVIKFGDKHYSKRNVAISIMEEYLVRQLTL